MRITGLLSLIMLSACKGDDVGLGDDDDQTTVDCAGADLFTAGTEYMTTSGSYVSILSASPAPPDVGDNLWTLSVRSDTGPTTGLAPKVTPWMPLHGHGLVPPDYSSVDLGAGQYEVELFDLIMPGLWEFTIDIGTTSPDTAVLPLCAEG